MNSRSGRQLHPYFFACKDVVGKGAFLNRRLCMVHKNWPNYSLLQPEFKSILRALFVYIDIPKSKNTLLNPTSCNYYFGVHRVVPYQIG